MEEFENNFRMSLLDHIAELRKRIILVAVVFTAGLIAGLAAAPFILSYLREHSPPFQVIWNVFSPWDGLRIYMSIAVAVSLLVTVPYAIYQIWLFVRGGLTAAEQKGALKFIPLSVLFFITGLCFAYFVVFPMSLAFTAGINKELSLVETYGVAQYFGFMFNIIVPLAAAFELPVVVLFLTRLGILSPALLGSMRRYAYLLLVVIAAFISPPDLISHLLVAIPLIGLYELSAGLARWMHSRQERSQLEVETPSSEQGQPA